MPVVVDFCALHACVRSTQVNRRGCVTAAIVIPAPQTFPIKPDDVVQTVLLFFLDPMQSVVFVIAVDDVPSHRVLLEL
ncbi:hypothetical protein N7535_007903 [Penicillium sp. DV-2018c]|nr:hypothetical protein N7461_003937 [Penicillium sp. DV-2018c]KAJ5566265.1 hypothetical protein N7535_007903 [Penicillium sp. DV-2018c]